MNVYIWLLAFSDRMSRHGADRGAREALERAYDYYVETGEPSRQAMLTHFAKGMLADSI
ncbi:MAG: hypothetical protein K2J49_02790 [Muribaculaceae bacterium]|nr:hypothetical protein [Muribaculaceae bacterium]